MGIFMYILQIIIITDLKLKKKEKKKMKKNTGVVLLYEKIVFHMF